MVTPTSDFRCLARAVTIGQRRESLFIWMFYLKRNKELLIIAYFLFNDKANFSLDDSTSLCKVVKAKVISSLDCLKSFSSGEGSVRFKFKHTREMIMILSTNGIANKTVFSLYRQWSPLISRCCALCSVTDLPIDIKLA